MGIFSSKNKEDHAGTGAGVSFDSGDEDAIYVIRCLSGNTDAFGAIVKRHQDKMLNMAYRMTSDYQDALDAVQDAFIAAYKNLSKFRGDSLFSTWLASIVINHARNRAKKRGRLKSRECASIDGPVSGGRGASGADPACGDPTPLDSVIKNELDMKVQECIGGLEEDQRVVLVLREIEGYAYDEIAGVLGLPDGTVRSRLFRARAILKECLKRLMGVSG